MLMLKIKIINLNFFLEIMCIRNRENKYTIDPYIIYLKIFKYKCSINISDYEYLT